MKIGGIRKCGLHDAAAHGCGGPAGADGHIRSLCQQGLLDRALDSLSRMSAIPSPSTYLSVLKACCRCKSLSHVRLLQAHVSLQPDHFSTELLRDYLVMTLAKCGAIDDALQLSASLPHLSIFSWTSLISACADSTRGEEALELNRLLQADGLQPDMYTFVSLFKACAKTSNLDEGMRLHADSHRKGFTSDVFVCNSLITMYGKCGALREAEDVFRSTFRHTTVSWNAMLSAYTEQNQADKALLLYRQMKEERVDGNEVTILSTLQACCSLSENDANSELKAMVLEIGNALHAHARRNGCIADVAVCSSLVSLYGKCGSLRRALHTFAESPMPNVVTWTAIISVHLEEHHLVHNALQLFGHMHMEQVVPNQLTYVVALQACSALADNQASIHMALEIGHALHSDVRGQSFASDSLVCSKLMILYSKCKAISEAEDVFHKMLHPDLFCWNAMLSVLAEQDRVEKIASLYRKMHFVDEITVMYVLQASDKAGSLELCQVIHFCIVSTGYDLVLSVMATLIHAYGGCGSPMNGYSVFDGLIDVDVVLWNACINNHAGTGDYVACFHVLNELTLTGSEYDKVTYNSILFSCCHTGLVVEGLEHFSSMSSNHCITPEMQHYGIMFDMLGRAADFVKIENMLQKMPMKIDTTVRSSLLGACYNHGNLEFAKVMLNESHQHEPVAHALH